MKKCFKCGESLPLSSFYKHPETSDGRVNKCKECNKADVRLNRLNKLEYYREYDRKRANLEHRVTARQEYSKSHDLSQYKDKWRRDNPEKVKAQNAVANAVRDGKLVKSNCERCGSETVHGHHEDYSKPLDVIWLCPQHHKDRHAELVKLDITL